MKHTLTFVGGVLYWPVMIPSWSQGWMWVWRSDAYASSFMPPHYNEVLREYFQKSVEEHDAEILEQNHFIACENAVVNQELRQSQGLATCLQHLRNARLLPMTWQEQNAVERTRLLSTFLGAALPLDVRLRILGFCDVNEVIAVRWEDEEYEVY